MGKKTPPPEEPPRFTNNPFAKLADKAEGLPPGPPPKVKPEPKGPARAVIRYERKGHGGKEVTRVEGLELKPNELEVWLKALKGQLGCGGIVDGDALQLQGDQRARLPELLEKRGVKRVVGA